MAVDCGEAVGSGGGAIVASCIAVAGGICVGSGVGMEVAGGTAVVVAGSKSAAGK